MHVVVRCHVVIHVVGLKMKIHVYLVYMAVRTQARRDSNRTLMICVWCASQRPWQLLLQYSLCVDMSFIFIVAEEFLRSDGLDQGLHLDFLYAQYASLTFPTMCLKIFLLQSVPCLMTFTARP
jgi:hypothetical protein